MFTFDKEKIKDKLKEISAKGGDFTKTIIKDPQKPSLSEALKTYRPSFIGEFEKRKQNKKISPYSVILASIAGDILAAPYKNKGYTPDMEDIKITDKTKFTKSTVYICSVLDAVLHNKSYTDTLNKWEEKYPMEAYEKLYGNEAAIIAATVGALFNTVEDVISQTFRLVTSRHDDKEDIKGAVVTAVCVYLMRFGTREDIYVYMCEQYMDLDKYHYYFTQSFQRMGVIPSRNITKCLSSVPYSIRAAYDSFSYMDFIRNICRFGHDTGAECAIAGGICYLIHESFDLSVTSRSAVRLPDDIKNILMEAK